MKVATIKNDTIYKNDSLVALCHSLADISIQDNGGITVNGKPYVAQYNMKEYTKQEAITDFCFRVFPKTYTYIKFYKATQL